MSIILAIILLVAVSEVNAGNNELFACILTRCMAEDSVNSNLFGLGCPLQNARFTVFGDSTYMLSSEMKTWYEARDTCHRCGYRLARVESREEQVFLSRWFIRDLENTRGCTGNRWCSVLIDGTDQHKEGCWQYTEPPLAKVSSGFTAWLPKMPDNFGSGEDCMAMTPNQGGYWNDAPCGLKFFFLCERSENHSRQTLDLKEVFASNVC